MPTVIQATTAEDVPDKPVDGKPTLVYWDLVGLVQPARLALVYAGVDFVDVRIEYGELTSPEGGAAWRMAKTGKLAQVMPFPNLPYYLDNTIGAIAQTNAILHHIGRAHDLMGNQPHMTDFWMDQLTDLEAALVRLAYGKGPADIIEWYKKDVPGILAKFSATLRGNFLTGDKPTVADFKFYSFLYKMTCIQQDLGTPDTEGVLTLDMVTYMKRIEELPNIKEYMASSVYQKRPINNVMAKWIGN